MQVVVSGEQAPAPGTVTREPAPGLKSRAEQNRYVDERIRFTLQTSDFLWRMVLENPSDGPLMLRWDEATMRSSDVLIARPLRASSVSVEGVPSLLYPEVVSPWAFALPAWGRLAYYLLPDQSDLFQSGQEFGVRFDAKGKLQSDAVGNWIELRLPVEASGGRWEYTVRLTLERSTQRRSWY